MYRFETIEEYRDAFEEAYTNGLVNGTLDDFDAIALLLMYKEFATSHGHIEGILDISDSLGKTTPEMEADTAFYADLIRSIVEVSTKKLEELGLL